MYWSDEQQAAYDNLKRMGQEAFNPVNTDQIFGDMYNDLLYGSIKSVIMYAAVFGLIIAGFEGVRYLWRKNVKPRFSKLSQ